MHIRIIPAYVRTYVQMSQCIQSAGNERELYRLRKKTLPAVLRGTLIIKDKV